MKNEMLITKIIVLYFAQQHTDLRQATTEYKKDEQIENQYRFWSHYVCVCSPREKVFFSTKVRTTPFTEKLKSSPI